MKNKEKEERSIVLSCRACRYHNVALTDAEMIEKKRFYLKFFTDNAYPVEWYPDYEKNRDDDVRDRLLEEHVLPFFPVTVGVGFNPNPNYSKLGHSIAAWVCPKCGTMKIDAPRFNFLEKQEAENRMAKDLAALQKFGVDGKDW
jgi:hypothetical protein